jgi:hypothetical protein
MKHSIFIFLLLTFLQLSSNAQELFCQVQVVSPQIQGTNEKRIFDNLQKSIFEFMNNTKWTNDVFSPEEKIPCNLLLNITEKTSTDIYKATLQIQSSRLIYKTGYSSVLMNHNDADIQFSYIEFQPIEFSINQRLSNLSSIFAYYAYVIIAMDYDSFSLKGGTPFWQKAQIVVSNEQNSNEKGWKSMEGTKNRFWIVDNMLQPTFAPMRECFYNYHRLGFDIMFQDVVGGRAVCLETILSLNKIHSQRPLSFPMQLFFNAKKDEVVKLFSGGLPDEKQKVVSMLQRIDPGNGILYQRIIQNQ